MICSVFAEKHKGRRPAPGRRRVRVMTDVAQVTVVFMSTFKGQVGPEAGASLHASSWRAFSDKDTKYRFSWYDFWVSV